MTKKGSRARQEAKKEWALWTNESTRNFLKFLWKRFSYDPRKPLLGIVEILLAVGIAISIGLYLDPDVNVVPAPWNYVAFVILVITAALIHRRTRPYRVSVKLNKQKRDS